MSYFDSICRLCLTQTGLYHIFETQDLLQDIYLCTGVSMLSTDPLPQRVCEKCFTIVIDAKTLRLIAKANDTNLRILCDNMNNDVQEQRTAEVNPNSGNEINDGAVETIRVNNEKPTENPCVGSDECNWKVVVITDKSFDMDISRDSAGQPHTISIRNDLCKEKSQNTEPETISIRNDIYKEKAPNTEDSIKPVNSSCEQEEKKSELDGTNIVKVEGDGGKNSFKCTLCVKSFKTWKQAYLHERIHCKHIKCGVCSKWFACKGDLVKHTRVHTGEKPYKCTRCDRSFSQRVTLRQHRQNIHNLKYMNDEVTARVKDSVPSVT